MPVHVVAVEAVAGKIPKRIQIPELMLQSAAEEAVVASIQQQQQRRRAEDWIDASGKKRRM
jgi:hypothetical protein